MLVVAWRLSISLAFLMESAKLQEVFLFLLAHPRQRRNFFYSNLADALGYSTPGAFQRRSGGAALQGHGQRSHVFPAGSRELALPALRAPTPAAAGSREALRADLPGNRLKGTNLVYGNPRLICGSPGRLRGEGEGGRPRSGLARAARNFWQLPGSGPSP